ncbi:GlxA family transcriptional regulator [Paucibacter sp. DJ2R-2]|uniref:GlxA family transcriptional regulator n=1 Tax=Paucibacter sp. DJ2R-2 TaxID=2893558 RepID=UPI0021E496FD|nr:helix-turn-helix domain-containing protein [Paucibacter sp. DJ2R-2]MCV2422287.1 helix-turn-helix domain-containing protein [Paucibacter sp. DJ4R-1]
MLSCLTVQAVNSAAYPALPVETGAATAALRRCGLLVMPGASLLALAGVLEALQAANGLQPEARYEVQLLSLDGAPAACCGQLLSPQAWAAALPLLSPERAWDLLLVFSGESLPADAALLLALQAQAAAGVALAGVDGGSALLAEAGLLSGQRATVNGAWIDALQEDWPEVVWSDKVWEMNAEASRMSCAGGSASLDLMVAWLGRRHGERFAQDLTLALGLERARGRDERQRRAVAEQRGGSPKLAEALSLMEANLAEPLPTEEVARLVGVSRRQLERLFKQHLDALPSRYYLELRLNRARRLLQQGSQSILQIGLSCGFSSGPHFSNAYKAHFDKTPRDERSQRAAAWRRPAGESPP